MNLYIRWGRDTYHLGLVGVLSFTRAGLCWRACFLGIAIYGIGARFRVRLGLDA